MTWYVENTTYLFHSKTLTGRYLYDLHLKKKKKGIKAIKEKLRNLPKVTELVSVGARIWLLLV